MPRTPLQKQHNQQVTELREKLRGLNLTDLESASKVSRATLWRVRQGRHVPGNATIDSIWAGIEALEQAENE